MLNELAEYKQYTLPVDDHNRLKYFTLIKGNFSGIKRALTIVARHHIFGDNNSPENFDADKIKNFLKAWCGFDFDKKYDVPENLLNFLPKYIRKKFLDPKIAELQQLTSSNAEISSIIEVLYKTPSLENLNIVSNGLKNIFGDDFNSVVGRIEELINALDDLKQKSNYCNKNIFDSYISDKNSFRLLNFDRIIADALLLGKLRNYSLVCDADPFEDFEIKKCTTKKPSGKNLLPANKDLILKLTAVYLINAKYNNQKFIPINQSDIINWLNKEKEDKFDLDQFKIFPSERRLFEMRIVGNLSANKKGGMNVKKISLDSIWLENFKLIEESEFNETQNRGRIFFSDNGFALPLEKNIG